MPAKQIARLSFETAQRALETQERAVEQPQSRASALLTTSSPIANGGRYGAGCANPESSCDATEAAPETDRWPSQLQA